MICMTVSTKRSFRRDFKIKSTNKLILDIAFWDGLDFKNSSIADIPLVPHFLVNLVVLEVQVVPTEKRKTSCDPALV